jgi:thiol-disulfide isomerase/thioredoxin
MIRRSKQFMIVLFLGVFLVLFACQLPGNLVRTISQIRDTVTPARDTQETVSVSQTPLSPYPGTIYDTAYPGLITGEPYPGMEGTSYPPNSIPVTEYPGAITDYPGIITQTVVPEETTVIYTGVVSKTLKATQSSTISPVATGTIAGFAKDGSATAFPTQQTVDSSSYPGSEIQASFTAYPGAESTQGLIPTLDSAYPGSGEAPTSYPPISTITSSSAGSVSSTATQRLSNVPSTYSVNSSTLTPTVFFVPTVTPTPTKTPFRTPTPTITPTPTNTRTPLPFPPWINSKLKASDPRTVKLASGKVQLVQFFAYWSGPSQAMAPLIIGLEKEYRGRANFVYLDIDNPANTIYKRQLGFRMEPHFFLLDPQGKILKQWIGYVTVEQLRKAFETALE